MAIQIGAKPDSGFDDPIGMLTDCHRRIERFLDVLGLVAERAHTRRLTGEERSAVQAALRYFHTGGERHTADEEESLFPRLRGATAAAGLESLDRLQHDHQHAAQLHDSVDWLYTTWISAGVLGPDEQERLLSETRQLRRLYSEHIEIEETIVFPHAVEVLDDQSLAAMKSEFIARRK
jgi:hemerythrin-like domain-containing protein